MKRVLFYCQHVLGMGHLIRSLEIVRGLDGFEVCFLNGGALTGDVALPANVRIVNLPVLQTDEEFRGIQALPGLNVETVKRERLARILEVTEEFRPDLAMIELFPFGRHKFSFELLPMLERIRQVAPAAKVVCSLRDIVVSKPDRVRYETKVRALLEHHFHLVLVHSDPAFQRLEESFVSAAEIRCPVVYTGFVARRAKAGSKARGGPEARIVASIGGGRVGSELLAATIEASLLLSEVLPHRVAIFTGPFLPEAEFERLRKLAQASGQVSVQRFTPSLGAQMLSADLSISMAGYNTCMDLVLSEVPALLYPFRGGQNEEQTIRAHKLQALGAASVMEPEDLEPERLARRILAAIGRRANRVALDTGGVQKSAQVLKNVVEAA